MYTEAWNAAQSGVPIIRPLFWENSQDKAFWDVGDEFLVGESLLVAPITQSKMTIRKVALPAGGWYSFWDDERYVGSINIELPVRLETIPIFIKSGTVLPMDEEQQLCLHIYSPLTQKTTSQIYFDGSDGYGAWRLDKYEVTHAHKSFQVQWTSTGDYPFPYSKVNIQLHGEKLSRATVDGVNIPINGNSLITTKFSKMVLSFE